MTQQSRCDEEPRAMFRAVMLSVVSEWKIEKQQQRSAGQERAEAELKMDARQLRLRWVRGVVRRQAPAAAGVKLRERERERPWPKSKIIRLSISNLLSLLLRCNLHSQKPPVSCVHIATYSYNIHGTFTECVSANKFFLFVFHSPPKLLWPNTEIAQKKIN